MPARIWYSSISAYAHDMGLSGEDFRDFVRMILLLDDEFLDFSADELERARAEAESRSNR
ncbi:MAG: hypothetical protein MUE84_08670 [Hyphomonas sp.]|nr:hypothetical protein [Hyphomonas sp.]